MDNKALFRMIKNLLVENFPCRSLNMRSMYDRSVSKLALEGSLLKFNPNKKRSSVGRLLPPTPPPKTPSRGPPRPPPDAPPPPAETPKILPPTPSLGQRFFGSFFFCSNCTNRIGDHTVQVVLRKGMAKTLTASLILRFSPVYLHFH